MQYEALIQKLLKIIMEYSGAEHGFLILENEGTLTIEAESIVENNLQTLVKPRIINEEHSNIVPLTILNFVSRVHEAVILDNASSEGNYISDEYIVENKCKSLLCLPIMHQDQFRGLLFLENNLAYSVFSTNRVQLMELLCSQAAISIQNSKLYNTLEDYSKRLETKVTERTRELEKVNENLMDINRLLRDARIEAERDMLMASNVQSSFMPKTYKDRSLWDMAYEFRPMAGVSGDFYDFYEIDGKLKGCCIFDVSGHGISSGLITVIARSIIYRHFSQQLDRPLHKVLESINEVLIQEIGHSGNYLTGVMVRFGDNFVEHVNAAHPVGIKYDAVKKRCIKISHEDDSWRGGFLGLDLMKQPYGSLRVPVNSGDVLLLFSDCLNEGKNSSKDEFGYKRICEALCATADKTAQEILLELTSQYLSFVGKETLNDDYTVIVMKKN